MSSGAERVKWRHHSHGQIAETVPEPRAICFQIQMVARGGWGHTEYSKKPANSFAGFLLRLDLRGLATI
jgi:hypothetical protein